MGSRAPRSTPSWSTRIAPGRSPRRRRPRLPGTVARAVPSRAVADQPRSCSPARRAATTTGGERSPAGGAEVARRHARRPLDDRARPAQLRGEAGGPLEGRRPGVAEGVVLDAMAPAGELGHQLRLRRRPLADDEEGGPLPRGVQELEDPPGVDGVGPVVEGEGQAVAPGGPGEDRPGEDPRAQESDPRADGGADRRGAQTQAPPRHLEAGEAGGGEADPAGGEQRQRQGGGGGGALHRPVHGTPPP